MDLMGYSVFGLLFALGLLVGWHEYGHYLAARLCGVKVVKFALGFGKPIIAKKLGKDQTEWSLRWIPLGGFAMMLNEDDPNCQPIDPKDLPRAFNRQPLYKRAIIVAAGPISNFLLAIILFMVVGLLGLKEPAPIIAQPSLHSTAAQVGAQEGDKVIRVGNHEIVSWTDLAQELNDAWLTLPNAEMVILRAGKEVVLTVPRPEGKIDAMTFIKAGFDLSIKGSFVKTVTKSSPADVAGLQAGDELLAVNGVALPKSRSSTVLADELKKAYQAKQSAKIDFLRGQKQLSAMVVPTWSENDQRAILGVGLELPYDMVDRQYNNPLDAFHYGLQQTIAGTKKTFGYIRGLLTAEVSVKTVGGMGTMAEMSGKTAKAGWNYYLHFLAWWSISLAVFNLLPIPFLDGGHLLYYGVEFVLRRRPSEKIMAWGYRLGGAILLGLMLLAHTNDAIRLLFN